ncbi:hypothetical protein BLNAU_20297 [Blattamonas nauphoetae]|uniref:Uncharacterized protein n=1 Tax=Blattamonas nauphoetae TaxID=2049346 RepID=A0ABQ9WZ21_9EUKA|nr:hypothetical protein BLNAU_20297 [Blattamonas nauphoetae]
MGIPHETVVYLLYNCDVSPPYSYDKMIRGMSDDYHKQETNLAERIKQGLPPSSDQSNTIPVGRGRSFSSQNHPDSPRPSPLRIEIASSYLRKLSKIVTYSTKSGRKPKQQQVKPAYMNATFCDLLADFVNQATPTAISRIRLRSFPCIPEVPGHMLYDVLETIPRCTSLNDLDLSQ